MYLRVPSSKCMKFVNKITSGNVKNCFFFREAPPVVCEHQFGGVLLKILLKRDSCQIIIFRTHKIRNIENKTETVKCKPMIFKSKLTDLTVNGLSR